MMSVSRNSPLSMHSHLLNLASFPSDAIAAIDSLKLARSHGDAYELTWTPSEGAISYVIVYWTVVDSTDHTASSTILFSGPPIDPTVTTDIHATLVSGCSCATLSFLLPQHAYDTRILAINADMIPGFLSNGMMMPSTMSFPCSLIHSFWR